MKIKPYKLTLYFSLVIILTGCVVTNPKFFSETLPTDDPTYGYAPENPVAIKNADLNSSIGSSYYYLSRLRSEKGNKLELIKRSSVSNPNYKNPTAPVTNRYTGQPLSYGGGPFLDYYTLLPKNEKDTIKIYINPYLKGKIRVPVGLKFEKE